MSDNPLNNQQPTTNNQSLFKANLKELIQHVLHFCRNLTPIILFATAGFYLLSGNKSSIMGIMGEFWNSFDGWALLVVATILFILNYVEFCIKYEKSCTDNKAKFSNQNEIAEKPIKNIILVLLIILPLFYSGIAVLNIIQEKFFKQDNIKNNSDVSYVNEHHYARVIYPKYTCILPFEIQEVWKNNLSYEIAEELENQILPDEKARTLQHKRMAERIKEIKNQAISSGVSVEIGNLIITCQPEMPKEQDNKQK